MEEAIQWTGRSEGTETASWDKEHQSTSRSAAQQWCLRNCLGAQARGRGLWSVCARENKNTGKAMQKGLWGWRWGSSSGSALLGGYWRQSQDTVCSWLFSSCFQAKGSAFTSYVNKLASWQQKHCKATYTSSPLRQQCREHNSHPASRKRR